MKLFEFIDLNISHVHAQKKISVMTSPFAITVLLSWVGGWEAI